MAERSGREDDECLFESDSKTAPANIFDDKNSEMNPSNDLIKDMMTPSASIGSLSSSILDQMRLEGDDDDVDDHELSTSMDATKDILVRVDNPEKHSSAVEAYVTFRVLTRTIRSDYDSHEYYVRRRYNDFIWLRGKLEETYPTHVIPPLPEKHSFQRLSRFNVEFIKARMWALNKFLQRLADHPVLSYDNDFQLFLTSKPFEFASQKQEGRGLLRRVSNAFQAVATGYMMKERAAEFETVFDYVQQFEERLGNIERIALRINQERDEYVAELQEFHPVFTLWSSSESQLGPALLATSTAIEKCSNAQRNATKNFADCGRTFREYALYAAAMKDALFRRDKLQVEYELTVEDLNARKHEREQLEDSSQRYTIGSLIGRNADDVKKEKQDRVDAAIESLIRQVDANNEKLESGNANLRADIERWHEIKNADLKRTFAAIADRQIEMYQSCLAAWEEAIQLIQETGIENPTSASGDRDRDHDNVTS